MPEPADVVKTSQWQRFCVIARVVHGLRVKQKRQIFVCMRENNAVDDHAFLPAFGITCGEFALFHVLSNNAGPNNQPATTTAA